MNQSWRRDYLRYKSYFLNVMGRYKERADIKVYIEVLLSLTTISIFAIFALRPTILTIAELLKEIEAKEETLVVMNQKISNLAKAQIIYDQKSQQIAHLRSAIPTNPNPDVFARQIEGLSGKHQTPIVKISLENALISGKQTETESKAPSKDKTPFPEGINELPISVSSSVAVEQYSSIANFISDLELIRRPVKIDRLVINATLQNDQNLLILAVDGRVPYYKGEFSSETQ